jgi:hypothetical protein
MHIIDLNIENENMINQTATILYEVFPHNLINIQEAIDEVHDCTGNCRISRVAFDDEINVLVECKWRNNLQTLGDTSIAANIVEFQYDTSGNLDINCIFLLIWKI